MLGLTNLMILSFSDFINTINEKCKWVVDYLYNAFGTLSGMVQILVVAGAAILIVLGAFSFIKKTWKLAVIIAVVVLVVFIVWTFLSKGSL